MSRTWKSRLIWFITSLMTYILTVSLGMNFYLYDQYKQVSEGCEEIQKKLMKHIEEFGDLDD